MTLLGIILTILIGAIIGYLGRLVAPGRQNIPIWLTILVGIAAAFLGTLLTRALGISTNTGGIDWIEHIIQVVLAAIGVYAAAALYSRNRTTRR